HNKGNLRSRQPPCARIDAPDRPKGTSGGFRQRPDGGTHMRSTILVAAIAAVLWSALPSTSHAAYQNGDLYLLSLAVPAPNTRLLQGIIRINPATGVSSLFYHTGLTLHAFVDYDAYRDMLVFEQSDSMLGINSSGTLTLLNHLPSNQVGALAARG